MSYTYTTHQYYEQLDLLLDEKINNVSLQKDAGIQAVDALHAYYFFMLCIFGGAKSGSGKCSFGNVTICGIIGILCAPEYCDSQSQYDAVLCGNVKNLLRLILLFDSISLSIDPQA